MATSLVELASNALARIGDSPITTLSEDNDRARLMNRILRPTLEAQLRAHTWNFATFRQSLVRLAAAPAFAWTYQYQLPTDPPCLRVVTTNLTEDEPWVIETYVTGTSKYKVLLTDATTVSIVFVGYVDDPTRWDALFGDAMELELAYKAAYALTRNATLIQGLQADRTEAWRRARSVDGQESRPLHRLMSVSLTQVR